MSAHASIALALLAIASVATLIVARGLDAKDLTLIINQSVPNSNHYEDYVHRVGRTGRAGKAGTAIGYHIETTRCPWPDQLSNSTVVRCMLNASNETNNEEEVERRCCAYRLARPESSWLPSVRAASVRPAASARIWAPD